MSDETIVLHFQGRTFVTAMDPALSGKFPAALFAKHMKARTFWAQNRLSRTRGTRCPAALQDVVMFYTYLLDRDVQVENIVLSGDSAGGNLVFALLRYIEEMQAEHQIPRPRAAMLWSPWVDVSSRALESYASSPRLRTDFLNLGLLRRGLKAYEPEPRGADAEPYLCLAKHPFQVGIPPFVNPGTGKLLYEEIKTFAAKMGEVDGNRVSYRETPDAPHDIILAGNVVGFTDETAAAVGQACDFLQSF